MSQSIKENKTKANCCYLRKFMSVMLNWHAQPAGLKVPVSTIFGMNALQVHLSCQ